MSVKMRQEVERKIVTAVIDALLEAGFTLSVDNGGEGYELEGSTTRDAILKAMFLADEDRLYANFDGKPMGWVYFIYGNDGWDVINDYTTNLESLIGAGTKTQKLIDKYSE